MFIVVIIVGLIVGIIIGFVVKKKQVDQKIGTLDEINLKIKSAEQDVEKVKIQAEKEAIAIYKDGEIKAKEHAIKIKENAEKEANEIKKEIKTKEQKLEKKEENIDKKLEMLEKKEQDLDEEREILLQKEREVQTVYEEQKQELAKVAGLSKEEATRIFMMNLEQELTHEQAVMIKEFERKTEEDKDKVSKNILSFAMSKCAASYVVESTHPAKIEEALRKSKKEVESSILEAGEAAMLECGVQNVHPEIIKMLGRLKYRTSYGQDVLHHSIEMSHLAGVMASELGLDVRLAKRSALLHDVGKAMTADHEGTHGLLGGEFLRRYKEDERVVNGAESHHNEVEKNCIESFLVQAADTLSATRPGARRETLEAYIKRLENLEKIANSFEGVESSYAIQAGREVRIIVNPEKITDDQALLLARNVAKEIEDNMQYPGMIKVAVIRESRAIEYAK
ncbi:MAG: Rnase Y domain-containing protein [Fusobacteria bacterium]|nr:Rnase Y domain-containing protein [Fusobacteriota bacterium]